MLPGGRGVEFVIVAAIALIVVGPKDLPVMLRKLGQFVGKMRAMADEFRSSFDEMARQSELDDLRKEVEALRTGQAIKPLQDLGHQMKSLDSDLSEAMLSVAHKPSEISEIKAPEPVVTPVAEPVNDIPPDKRQTRARAPSKPAVKPRKKTTAT